MAGGRQAKKPRPTPNISGLRNQSRQSSRQSSTFSTPQPTPPRSRAPSPESDESDLEEDDEDLDILIHFDSLKTHLANAEAHSDEEKDEEVEEWEGFSNEDLAEAMVGMFEVDDPRDLDWLPERLKNKRDKRKSEKKGVYSHTFCAYFTIQKSGQNDPRHIRKAQM
jgi:hypothetical protein